MPHSTPRFRALVYRNPSNAALLGLPPKYEVQRYSPSLNDGIIDRIGCMDFDELSAQLQEFLDGTVSLKRHGPRKDAWWGFYDGRVRVAVSGLNDRGFLQTQYSMPLLQVLDELRDMNK